MSDPSKTKNTLKILAVHRYYWPDTPPYASILKNIVERLNTLGHEVDVLSSQPSYKADVQNAVKKKVDNIGAGTVHRLNLPNETGRPIRRITNALKLGVSLLFKALVYRYDVIMISTSPPVLGGFFAALASKMTGARFIYHCMDIHPEIGRISGEFSNPLVYKLLLSLDSWACDHASPIVVLSKDMKESLQRRSEKNCYSVEIINNFSLPSMYNECRKLPFQWPEGAVTLLFAGNIGRFQGLEIIIAAMEKLSHRQDIHVVIMGSGAAKAGLEEQAKRLGINNIHFVGHHSTQVAKLAMRKASVGFVSLKKDIFRYAYPSKTMAYLEQGCPILVAVEESSQLARDVEHNYYGCSVEPGDSDGLARQLEALADDKLILEKMRENAVINAKKLFSEKMILDEWEKLFLSDEDYKC